MTTAAPVLDAVALVVLFGNRSVVQHRRTGSAGFHGISGTPARAGWWGGVLFVVAMAAGLAGPLLAVLGVGVRAGVPPDRSLPLQPLRMQRVDDASPWTPQACAEGHRPGPGSEPTPTGVR